MALPITAKAESHDKSGAADLRLLLMHQVMLGDTVRMQAYDRALAQSIKPGDVVLDVGSGLLALSLLALRHGARHVYAVEGDPQTAALAQQIAEHNTLRERLTIIQGDARTVRLPVKANVIVSEMMGNFGPEEEMAEIIRRAARLNLRAGGQVVPSSLTSYLQAVELDNEGWGIWGEDFFGYSLSCIQEYAPAVPQLHFFSRTPRLLGAPVVVAGSRLGQDAQQPQGDYAINVKVQGRLHAVMGYFSATLSGDITISNFPTYPGCNWAPCIWPMRHTDVSPGDVIRIHMKRPKHVRVITDWRLDCQIDRAA
jgi:protein arginine N-methyltransferase 1